jgi:phosphoglycolate phosphatase-like HAD superfamily hydrolase
MMLDEESGSPASAVLFDVDGTLVDSNYLHIHAWGARSLRWASTSKRGGFTAR